MTFSCFPRKVFTNLVLIAIAALITPKALSQHKSSDLNNKKLINGSNPFVPLAPRNGSYINESSPLNDASFNRMMSKEFSNTLLGTKSPVSGFKIETSTPSVTLSGNIFSDKHKSFITTLELTGAVQNNISQIFSGDKLNGIFKASIGFNILISHWQRAKYNISNTEKGFNHARIDAYGRALMRTSDTATIYTSLYKDYESKPDYATLLNDVFAKITAFRNQQKQPIPAKKDIDTMLISIVKEFSPSDTTDADFLLDRLFQNIPSGTIKKPDIFLARYRKASQQSANLNDLINDSCINIFKNIWSSKSIWWANISPSLSNANTTFYDSTKKTIKDASSFLFGLQLSLNYLKRFARPNQFLYVKFALDFLKINNVADLSTFTYRTTDLLNSNPAALSIEKSGTASIGQLSQGFGTDFFIESYMSPFSSQFIPGLYIKSKISNSNIWLNTTKLSAEIGLLWNIANSDKTKSIVSIVPYVAWSNLLRNYKDASKTETSKLSDLFSVGIKFGIPINIGN